MGPVKDLKTIGWREKVDLPDWGISNILAKSDTGALSSAIDVASVEELPGDRVRFEVRLSRKKPGRLQAVEADIVRRAQIRSSNGQDGERLIVATRLRVGNVTKEVEFGLVCRKRMICRVLLGRRALEGDFLVDCTTRHILSAGRGKAAPKMRRIDS